MRRLLDHGVLVAFIAVACGGKIESQPDTELGPPPTVDASPAPPSSHTPQKHPPPQDPDATPSLAIISFTATEPEFSRGASTTLTAVFTGGTGSVDGGIGAVTSGVGKTTSPLAGDSVSFTLTVTSASAEAITKTLTLPRKKELYVSSYQKPGIAVFDYDAKGNVAPKRYIAGPAAKLEATRGLAIANGEIFAAQQDPSVVVFDLLATGDVAPKRRIGGLATTMSNAAGPFIVGGDLYLGDQTANVKVWSTTDDGNVAPKRVVTGALTGLWQATYVAISDGEIYAANHGKGTVTVHPVTATGNEPPSRTITLVDGYKPDGIVVHGSELVVTTGTTNAIHFYDKTTGAFSRAIRGDVTQLSFPDQIVVHGGEIYSAQWLGNRVVVFPANAQGNVPPSRVISGTSTMLAGPLGVYID